MYGYLLCRSRWRALTWPTFPSKTFAASLHLDKPSATDDNQSEVGSETSINAAQTVVRWRRKKKRRHSVLFSRGTSNILSCKRTLNKIANAFRITNMITQQVQEPGNLMQQCIVVRGIALAWKILMEELHPSHWERNASHRRAVASLCQFI